MRRFLPDQFTLILIATVAFASFFPAVGKGASFMLVASNLAISLLFFLHGARLSTDAIVAGVKDVRLHALILGCTFILFPALGLALRAAFPGLLTPALWLGVIFVCTLSSTVQSSIAFTSMARGNAVSYTHLDVYKRQGPRQVGGRRRRAGSPARLTRRMERGGRTRRPRLPTRLAARPPPILLSPLCICRTPEHGPMMPHGKHRHSCLLYTSRCV